jgi:hypothetical protein
MNATPEQKASLEAHNKAAGESMGMLQGLLKREVSPANMAEFAIGTVIAYRNKALLEAKSAELTKVTIAKDAEITKLTGERDALQKQLNALKNAEVPRTLPGTTAGQFKPAVNAPKPGQVDIRTGEQAFEDYEREAAAARA